MTDKTPRALREYRALDATGKASYNPAGKPGADQVRRLQELARLLREAREARGWRQTAAKGQLLGWRTGSRVWDVSLPRDAAKKYHILPLGPEDAEIADAAARAAHPRRQNWITPTGVLFAVPAGYSTEESFEYRGRFKRWQGCNYAPAMRALARISLDGAILTAIIGYSDGDARPEAVYTVQAGRGYRWGVDANGVCLVRTSDGADYHPSTDDIRAGRAAIIAALRERAAQRAEAARRAKREERILRAAAKGGVWVCLADSLKAGNCRYGTEAWARRHGLDIRRHYRADALPAPSTPDESRRIALVVLAATRRQAHELAQGFCEV